MLTLELLKPELNKEYLIMSSMYDASFDTPESKRRELRSFQDSGLYETVDMHEIKNVTKRGERTVIRKNMVVKVVLTAAGVKHYSTTCSHRFAKYFKPLIND